METEASKKIKISTKEARKLEKKKANELPLGLTESEILPRLPAKSVGRYTSSTTEPFDDHKLLLLDGATFRKLSFTDTIPASSNPHPTSDVEVLASLDGLVLVSSLATIERPSELVLWNPLTGAYMKLSSNGPDDMFYYLPTFGVVSFCKDDTCNDYKLVYLDHRGVLGAYIYSHKLDAWREIEFSFAFKETGAFCHWSQATFFGQKIQFPTVPSTDFCGSLVVLNGRLHLCVTYDFIDDFTHQDIWRMDGDGDGDGDGWVKVAAALQGSLYAQQVLAIGLLFWIKKTILSAKFMQRTSQRTIAIFVL
ncbi:hypothetical protein R6Q59_026354 [Mikania micrantha]